MGTRRGMLTGMVLAATLSLVGGAGSAIAQDKLDLATIVVGFPPGGGTDTTARIVAEKLSGTYADSVIVENRPGAGGRIAAAYVKDCPTDGSCMLFTPAFPLIIHPHLYADMPFDTLNDFVPVATTHFGVLALSVGPGAPESIKTLEDFLNWAKENPDQASFGGPVGGSQHFTGILLSNASGVDLELIGYPGGAPSVTDALGGHIPAVITPMAEVLPHAAEGTLRILAATSKERSKLAPDIPTFTELGYDIVVQDWSGFLMPAGTPAEVVERANAAISSVVETQDVIDRMGELGMEAQPTSVADFAKVLPESYAKYGKIIEDNNIEVQ
ncbi:tripartite tricarboxylate transporter substrate-binding protein [Oricola sp.]|uniref:tripartite tricarboxylate transporter substrate-binding protein n=1 Tax=Oricola sp. TaxID=1979950 RepID=UPI0025E5054E|nr:tripartite tricarboxylate transporter substrate-binding protein [Oricola sp.]MCI5075076.1 hypothetical protein [Oricola sp.]